MLYIRTLKSMAIATTILAASATGASALGDLSDNQTVRDARGNVVLSEAFHTCVRTEWETLNNEDPCAPKKMEVVKRVEPRPAPTPARTLEKADRTIYFGFDSTELTPDSQEKLNNLAWTLQNSHDVRDANIVGYADPIGAPQYNMTLSQQRAQTVQQYLTGKGYVNTQVVESRGLGETSKYAECKDIASRQARIECLEPNRRVEVEVKFLKDTETSYRQ